ncbi:hypothetical protein [Streptomyces sp. WMMB 322]|uniref:hypothetical protein n=1 Tax=Streptomyces sp. WMMB 322 TaxID=1286821 RepID=UPI0006E44F43|nr:hypothetical protein [Streptomyces sp. WMMB 322]SCK18194.1 hypothetical protein H180DRAFT_01253 [Streptomyces sp. WMMB 322]
MSDGQPAVHGQAEAPGAPVPPEGGGTRQDGTGTTAGGRGGFSGPAKAVAAGAAVVVCLVLGGYFYLGADDAPEYRLTTPKTVAGEYQRDGKGEKGDGEAFDNKKVPGMTSNADVSAEYKAGTTRKLQLGGAYGSVANPEKAVDWVFEQTGKSLKTETGAKAEGALGKFSPSGFDGDVLKCQEYKISRMSLVMCGWADSSTVGTVSSMILTSDGTSTEPVDLKETAELTAKVRKDALVEAG